MSSAAGIRVWGIGTSRTMRPHWMLAELGLEYETREISPRTAAMDDPDFKTLNQRGKVPVFQQGDLVIGESGAIVLHLGEQHRDRANLLPLAGSNERAAFDDLFLFTLMELDAPLYVIRRHGGLPDVYGESPVAVESAGQYFQRQVAVMDRRLADARPYLMGSNFSAVDILLSTCLAWAGFVKLDISGRLQDYQARVGGREAYSRALKRNFPPGAAPVPDASTT